MKYFAMTLNLKNDEKLISEYKSFHRNVWPEVLEALKNIGIIAVSYTHLTLPTKA